MKKTLTVLALLAIVCVAVAGCEEGGGGGGSGEPEAHALKFAKEQGVQPLEMSQHLCPVCDGKPIKKNLYHDLQRGGQQARVWFDKQECLDKFEENPGQYLQYGGGGPRGGQGQ